ncbi:hypothetical protein F383_32824 [Gossypium arboreum]|uniref:Uncharacterized protein n=1 Tax=Gossypium arboreum TaxID=29729 RepID=A0A0B0PQ10_GOSAR|nr:hypothetical protein F383_32824 [Gossypium arboreum]
MPLSQTGSYTKSHIEILCHDMCILTIPMIRTGLFGRCHIIRNFSNFSYSTQIAIHHYSLTYKQ